MKICLSLVVLVLFVTGCVSKQAMLVNPDTGQTQNCGASGWGWFGAPYASHMYNKCVLNMRANGYKYPYEISSEQQQALLSDGKENYSEVTIVKPKLSNVREAKIAYKAGQISKSEYKSTIYQLKSNYKMKVREIKLDFNTGKIDELEYRKRITIAKMDYSG
ncbi:hypothetical protein ACNKU7_18280 [Microbulbifer sp. SA54]|uniref:hypothetical protein n=1 Tax=Microbulbifer sp. SA54 TaxID=3401577 RepID=UPI003AAB3ADF